LSFQHPTEPTLAKRIRQRITWPDISKNNYNAIREWAEQQVADAANEHHVPVLDEVVAVQTNNPLGRAISNDDQLQLFKDDSAMWTIECIFTYHSRPGASSKRSRLYSDIANLLHARVAQLENRLVAWGVTLDG